MTTRVTLVSPSFDDALHAVRFPADEALTPTGLRRARAARPAAAALPADRALTSPSARCEETAEALGLRAAPDPGAAGCAMGRWRGLALEDVLAAEPEGVAAWLTDPDSAAHGGEPLTRFLGRVTDWLTGLAAEGGRVMAVVEPDVVRAAVVCALGAPPSSFWRVDVPPLTVTALSGRDGRWNVRVAGELGQGAGDLGQGAGDLGQDASESRQGTRDPGQAAGNLGQGPRHGPRHGPGQGTPPQAP
ncbi:histidine phosphatase family protein [Streptomyces rimosus]|uniref:histidine phosphatase family protein n=1 Tax=Streptomyces rimosus TaxID=1927 RepID=UPI0007C58788|nr:histidine phosphatase family protein [Streptomyces rimosus]